MSDDYLWPDGGTYANFADDAGDDYGFRFVSPDGSEDGPLSGQFLRQVADEFEEDTDHRHPKRVNGAKLLRRIADDYDRLRDVPRPNGVRVGGTPESVDQRFEGHTCERTVFGEHEPCRPCDLSPRCPECRHPWSDHCDGRSVHRCLASTGTVDRYFGLEHECGCLRASTPESLEAEAHYVANRLPRPASVTEPDHEHEFTDEDHILAWCLTCGARNPKAWDGISDRDLRIAQSRADGFLCLIVDDDPDRLRRVLYYRSAASLAAAVQEVADYCYGMTGSQPEPQASVFDDIGHRLVDVLKERPNV